MRWVLPHGALGVATGAIAIGTVATLRSTTIIITIRTTISTAMSVARDKVIGSTIRNTAEMLRMETGKQPISLADVAPVAPVVPVVRVALVVSEDPAVSAVRAASVVSESPAEPAARERELVQVEPELERDPVVGLELEHDPVVALEQVLEQVVALELEHDPVVALEQVHGQVVGLVPLIAQLAVALRTKSVTAAHRPDLVPLLEAEEDLAAVAETTREPAAAEAVIAWEVAE